MALIIQPEGFIKSGKIGGTVYARNRAGYYVRSNRMGNAPTTASDIQKGIFQGAAQGWRGLSYSDQLAWNSAAPNYPYVNRLGQVKTYSGFQLHMLINTANASHGWPYIPVPATLPGPFPSLGIVDAGTRYTLDISTPADDSMTIVTTDDLSAEISKADIYMTRPMSPGIFSPVQDWKRVRSASDWADYKSGSAVDFHADYEAIFGRPTPPATPLAGFLVIWVKIVGIYDDTSFQSGYHKQLIVFPMYVEAVA